MLWIKRNLFLVGFGLVACGLLAGGLFYLWSSRAKNLEVEAQVAQSKEELENLLKQKPSINASNITTAKAQLQRVRQEITNAQRFFQSVPVELITNQQPLKALLNQTVFQLQQQAESSGVDLPKKDYAFSFDAQQKQLNLVPASFPTLCAQLAEIKAISLILFEAKINRLVHVKRWRVSIDDPPGSNDYHDFAEGDATNKLTGTVGNPYEVKFHCFSPELAAVLEGLYKAPYGLTVKSLAVEPAPVSEIEASGRNLAPPPGPGFPSPQNPAAPRFNPNVRPPPPGAPRPPPGGGPAKDILQVVLDERLLSVTLRLEVNKFVK